MKRKQNGMHANDIQLLYPKKVKKNVKRSVCVERDK